MGIKISAIVPVAASVATGDKIVLLDVSNTSESPQGTTSVVSPDVLSPYRTGAAIKAAYESEPSAFTDALFTKLAGIATGADVSPVASVNALTGAVVLNADHLGDGASQVMMLGTERIKLDGIEFAAKGDQTGPQIKALYEAEVSAFTDALFTKLGGIEALADVTDAGSVATAGAIMDSDIVEDLGYLIKTGVGTYQGLRPKFDAAGPPGASNDSSQGYGVGSPWIDTTNDTAYQAIDVSVGAAIWHRLSAQDGAEIKALYEAEANAYTDAKDTKLAGIATGADVSPVASVATKTGAVTLDADDVAETLGKKWLSNTEQVKLSGIETAATADQTDVEVKTAYENNADTNALTDDRLKLLPKAFFSFDPVASGVSLESNSYNASGISRTAAGRYNITFTNSITPPYTVTCSFRDTTNTINIVGTEGEASGSVDVFVKNGADALFDGGEMVHIVIHQFS